MGKAQGGGGIGTRRGERRKPSASAFRPVYALLALAVTIALLPLWLGPRVHDASDSEAGHRQKLRGKGMVKKGNLWRDRGRKEPSAHQIEREGAAPKKNDEGPNEMPEWQEPHNNEVWDRPDGWESYGFYRIRKHFRCSSYAHDQTKPLPTLEDWRTFQTKYREIVDGTVQFDDPVPPTEGYSMEGGGPPPYYAKHSKDGRGRGLFASRDIKKGELTHDGTHSDVHFPSGMAWRTFIFSLPRNKACDMIDWTWTQKLDDGKFHIFAAINISVLHNGASRKMSNVNPREATSSKFYATRDIKKDEELLTDYGWYDTVWGDVGL